MMPSWIVLIGDEETGAWSVALNCQTELYPDSEQRAREFYNEMRGSGDMSPAILLFTGDFVTV
jgi:hypothetical protein